MGRLYSSSQQLDVGQNSFQQQRLDNEILSQFISHTLYLDLAERELQTSKKMLNLFLQQLNPLQRDRKTMISQIEIVISSD